MSPWRTIRRFAPVAFLATGACFATRNDVRILQGDMQRAREEAARADAEQARQLAQVSTVLATLNDSLRVANQRIGAWQADVRGNQRSIEQQLLQILELTGASQRRLQELRAEMEARAEQMAVPPASAAPTTTPPGGATARDTTTRPAAPTVPGPNQLYQLSYDQLRRSSYGAARAGFEELLRNYPTSDLAPDAQFYIAESYAAEGNAAAADSTYAIVLSKWPRSPRAPTALYKQALQLQRTGKATEARALFQRVVDTYPSSDEAELAREALRGGR